MPIPHSESTETTALKNNTFFSRPLSTYQQRHYSSQHNPLHPLKTSFPVVTFLEIGSYVGVFFYLMNSIKRERIELNNSHEAKGQTR